MCPLFPLGKLVTTPGVLRTVPMDTVAELFIRHARGDWGDRLVPENAVANETALRVGGRLFSVYRFSDHSVWVITEEDRSVTTALLPEEY